MMRTRVAQRIAKRIFGFLLFFSLFLLPMLTFGQTAPKRSLITQSIDETNLTLLKGNTYPLARAEFDRGAAPLSLPMERMLLVLKRSPELEAALGTLLDEQQDKSSPNFHNWLTPEQFGQQFGPSDGDIQAVSSWLQSHGFQVAKVAKGRTVIEFSGTAEQVQGTFRTTIHKYVVDGAEHWANASDPQIPSALAPVVAGPLTLHNFPRQPMYHATGVFSRSRDTGEVKPVNSLFTLSSGCGGPCFALGPYDFATIYNVLPLWNSSPAIDGTGESIAIVAESDIDIKDIQAFRSLFGLPQKDPQIILDGPDPGVVPGDETESDLDVEWAGAVARNATIKFVISATTDTTLGVDLSAQYITDNNIAPIMSVSYGICEAGLGTAGNLFFNQLWQQASAQGITVLVATGDSGSATCDRFGGFTPQPARFGLQVSGFASTPFNVAVGGTDFNDVNNPTTFWNTSNDSHQASAKGYIPEITWNDSCTSGLLADFGFPGTPEANCNNPTLIGTVFTGGGSGGMSRCTTGTGQDVTSCSGGYAKPTWQTGTGVPADGKRDIPDVSLFASGGFYTSNFYIICAADLTGGYCDPNNPSSKIFGVGGTSASAPSFAGIMALVDQKTQSRQGNANYVLYKLAAQPGAPCPSVANPASSCVFYDVTSGTIAMPCAVGSPNCTVSKAGDQFGVLSGYPATAGYDLATGLGSVNASNLVNKWDTVTTQGSVTTLNLTPTPVNITHGQSVNFTIDVTPAVAGGAHPTGNVALIANTGPSGQEGVQGFALNNGAASGTTNVLPGGNYTVVAQYPGDGVFGPSTSSTTSVTVAPEASTVQFAFELFNPSTGQLTNPNATSATYGSLELLRMNVSSQSGDTCPQNAPGELGCPSGSVVVTNNGAALDAGTYQLNTLGYTEDKPVQLPGGTNNLKAVYGGDNSFSANTGTATITITKAATVIDVSTPSNNAILGGFVTFNANIQSLGFGAGPTGQVTFFAGATQLGSPVPVTNSVPGSFNGNPQAQATINTSQLPLGPSNITAQYSGDGNYATSTSSPIGVDVRIPTTCSISSSSLTIAHGSSVTFTYSVKPTQAGGPGPSGSILFTANTTIIGTIPLANGQAQVTTSALPGGNIDVVGNYNGDSNYTLCGAALVETVNLLPTTTTISSSNPSVQQGQSVTLTAHVAPVQAGGPTLTGTVQFLSSFSLTGGDTPLGSAPLSNGQAQITTTALPANTQFVFAGYSGDSNYANSTGSAPQTVTAAPDFSIGANPQTIVVSSPGSTGSTMLTFTALNGFSGTINLSPGVCSGLPAQSSCSFSPSSVTLNTTTTIGTTTLTVSTMAPSNVAPHFVQPPTGMIWLMVGIAAALAFFFLLSASPSTRRWNTALALLAFAALLTFAACGGGGGGGPHNPGTPIGVDPNVVVSISGGGVSHNIQLTVNVK
jgi:hypothetical protein